MVMTRAARVSTAFLKPSRIPLRTAGFRAFRCSGRLIVILATPCSTEYKTSLINFTFGEKYHGIWGQSPKSPKSQKKKLAP